MDNYLKHLLDKLPYTKKEFSKERNICQIKIIIQSKYDNIAHHLQNISEIYKAVSEIIIYLEKMGKVIVEYTLDEIKILY